MKNKSITSWSFKILLAVFSLLEVFSFNACAEELLLSENLNKIHILPHGIGIPIGKILLVKNGNKICAVRFTSVDRGHDKKEPSIWSSGEESKYAEFDWYCFGDSPRKEHKKLSLKAPKGIGRLAFQTGCPYIKFGSLKLFWSYPTYVYFPEFGGSQKEGLEVLFSPTNYQDFNAIDLKQNHTWYGYDENRKRHSVDLKSLEK